MINKNYWDKFYKKFNINKPSNFAKFIVKSKEKKNNSRYWMW